MKNIALIGLAIVSIAGCGGGGGSAASFAAGKFNGTVVEGTRASAIVELTVTSSQVISGKCTVLSSTSGAIMGEAILTGSVNLSNGLFEVGGIYHAFLPPPPGGGTTGIINVSGKIPARGVAQESMIVDDNGISFGGMISPTL